MLTISQVASRFGLSRSTLLYYDRIGLLSPTARSRANYRLYTDGDLERMERIAVYRRAGLPLADIKEVLSSGEGILGLLLQARLQELNREIGLLRDQQRRVVGLLQEKLGLAETRSLSKADWIEILEASGLDDDDMDRWHVEFERLAPEAHQDFLESLGLDENEISRIRKDSGREW